MNWRRLAELAKTERERLGLTQEEVAAKGGPSTASLRLIEGALQTSYRGRTLRQLEDALGWRRGSVAAILEGGEPTRSSMAWQQENPAADLRQQIERSRVADETKRFLLQALDYSERVNRGA